jgi:hypothetical protein
MTGHLTILAHWKPGVHHGLSDNAVPLTINYETPDLDCDLTTSPTRLGKFAAAR